MSKILILGELNDGEISTSTRGLISIAQKINFDPNHIIELAFFHNAQWEFPHQFPAGVLDKVYLIVDPLLDTQSNEDLLSTAFFNLCNFSDPSIILITKSRQGSNIGPRTAYKMNVPIVQGVTEVKLKNNSESFSLLRPVYGGNIMAEVEFDDVHPKIITINEGSADFSMLDLENVQTQIFDPKLKSSMIRSTVVDTIAKEVEGVPLSDAKVIVAGGRGLGDPKAFDSLKELAKLFNGAVGASRAACDAGWIDHSFQVGLTGQSVAPELYVAIGISGASQHMAGCAGSRNIIAINKDPDASIFLDARFGIVGDWKEIIPAFKEALEELIQ